MTTLGRPRGCQKERSACGSMGPVAARRAGGTPAKTILLAVEDAEFAARCGREFTAAGYEILRARDGREAFSRLRHEWPDLVVLDLCRPIVGGLRALGQIRDFAPEIPVVLITDQDERQVNSQLAGLATACLHKSYDFVKLKQTVALILLQIRLQQRCLRQAVRAQNWAAPDTLPRPL